MTSSLHPILLFTDVDGCLLNKTDYDCGPAIPVLRRLRENNVPVILSSSKTGRELRALAAELKLSPAPLICENGGQILWQGTQWPTREATCPGTSRDVILDVLSELKLAFRFRSFRDLGLEGVMQATDLPSAKAQMATERSSTEPLLWDDAPERIEAFRESLSRKSLTLTKGGRFWHVAGAATKGAAMKIVVQEYRNGSFTSPLTVAIGDSPIDQSMLNIADVPIGIPAPDGTLNVDINTAKGVVSAQHGSLGWAESVARVLDNLMQSTGTANI
ncbi:MAG: HAD-IIB family hydrolase [Planctomycetaceae bacterium]|nr:HAD-IIB family hydrolase [Planctomycetaceae bacterium]